MAGRPVVAVLLLGLASSCSGSDEDAQRPPAKEAGVAEASWDVQVEDAGVDAPPEAAPPCGDDMVHVDDFCIDRYEAPNVPGQVALVMYTFVESEAWCAARGKRLCFDDEWTRSCAGVAESKYPYGDTHEPGICNDDKLWKLYDQQKLNGWPITVSKPEVETLTELLATAKQVSQVAAVAADHVEWLYQGEAAGESPGCTGPDQVFDLEGNVEEWTRRRDGGTKDFHGSLKGRYWAEPRTCQSAVNTHGDGFRFYEIGFRCCRDLSGGG